jgi:hypothetical protein
MGYAEKLVQSMIISPSSKVRSRKTLTILQLTPTEHPNRSTLGSAYVRSQLPFPTPSGKLDTLLGVTAQTFVRPSDSLSGALEL